MSRRVLVAGAGVFGTHLARAILRRTDAQILLSARRPARVRRAHAALGDAERVEPCTLHLSDLDAFRDLAKRCTVVACAAGPFDSLPRDLPRVAAEAGAHWVDISEEPRWVLGVLADEAVAESARMAGVGVLPGRSTLPALSCALVSWCTSRMNDANRASITLTIGNKNPKGAAAISAAISGGFRQPAMVATPLGRLAAWRFDSPDRALLAPAIQADVRVALEWAPAAWIVAMAHRLPARLMPAFAHAAEAAATVASPFGTQGGAIQAEVFGPQGQRVAAAVTFPQHVAVAPAAQAISAILSGTAPPPGVVSPLDWPGPQALIEDAIAAGARFLKR